ncbi:MAG: hypothetical protein LN589_01285 [Rickettsia endosymbiont of Eriopis connexa]|nr:hypothetical protein [Rickettsia endosymbiont of Eriopis connexa]
MQEKQKELVKITKQDIESSLQKISFELENYCNANKNFIQGVLFEKIQKLGDNKANLPKIDKKIQIIIEDINHISKKCTLYTLLKLHAKIIN